MNEKDIQICYERQMNTVYKLACMTCKDPVMAEDVLQDVFCQYILKSPRFHDEEHEKAWFIRVTINRSKNLLKSKWNRDRMELADWDGKIEESDEPEEWELLWEAILQLSDKYRAVIHLYYYEEYSVKEIAHILRRRETTIQTQLQRGREQLKKIMEERRTPHDR